MEVIWPLFCDQISDSADRFSVFIHSFVLMNNHFHMMVSTPLQNLDKFLRHCLTETARTIQRKSGRINHIFGGRTNQTILDTPQAVAYVYKYIYRNPVRAQIVSHAEHYRYSSLSELLSGHTQVPLSERFDNLWALIPKDNRKRVDWLNAPTPKEKECLIAKSLRRSHFRFSSSHYVRKDLFELIRLYGVHDKYDPYLSGPEGE